MWRLTFEAIPATKLPGGSLTVRVFTSFNGSEPLNCGLLVMTHDEFAALALRPPSSDLVVTDCIVFGEPLAPFVERLVAA